MVDPVGRRPVERQRGLLIVILVIAESQSGCCTLGAGGGIDRHPICQRGAVIERLHRRFVGLGTQPGVPDPPPAGGAGRPRIAASIVYRAADHRVGVGAGVGIQHLGPGARDR